MNPFALALAGLVALAYLAPWPLLVNTFAAWTGDPSVYAFDVDAQAWAHRTLFLAVFLVVAAFLWETDRWLSGIVALAGGQTFYVGPHIISGYLLIAVGVTMLFRRVPEPWRVAALRVFAISGLIQALMVYAQWWRGVPGVGSLGISGLAAIYLALTGLLLPGTLLPVIAGAIALTGSRWGLVAFALGLLVRYAPTWPWVVAPLVAVLICVAGVLAWQQPDTMKARLEIARPALADTTASVSRLLFGAGLGQWSARQATTRLDGGGGPHPRSYTTAHNDWLQWFYETGLLGVALAAGWLVRWRRLSISIAGPSLVAVSVMALAWFPLHDLRTGFIAAALVGLGSPMNEGA